MEFRNVLNTRQSIRKFQSTEIPDEQIEEILELASLAPSAGNLQAFKIVIVKNVDIREKLSEAALSQSSVAEAPVDLVICAAAEESAAKYGDRGRDLYCVQDATIFAAYLQLVAAEQGLGTVWVGAFDEEEVRDVLGISEDLRPIAIIPMGYPAEKPARRGRKSLKEIIYKEL